MSNRPLAVLTVAVLLAAAFAQDLEPIGSVRGTVDGEPFDLFISEGPSPAEEGVTVSNAYWNRSIFGGLDVTIIGQSRPSLFSFTPGSMMLDFVMAGPPWVCPCPAEQVSLFYSPDGGFTSNVYQELDAESTVESIEELAPGVYRIVGTFGARLGLKEGIMDRPDPDRSIRIDGAFTIERLAEEEDW
jgi:hypothetical protein